jgi:hypothetical protein
MKVHSELPLGIFRFTARHQMTCQVGRFASACPFTPECNATKIRGFAPHAVPPRNPSWTLLPSTVGLRRRQPLAGTTHFVGASGAAGVELWTVLARCNVPVGCCSYHLLSADRRGRPKLTRRAGSLLPPYTPFARTCGWKARSPVLTLRCKDVCKRKARNSRLQ